MEASEVDQPVERLLCRVPHARLLLSDAMHTTAEREDGSPVRTLNTAPRVEPSKKIERDVIIRIVEDTHDNETVANVVVDVREVGPVSIGF